MNPQHQMQWKHDNTVALYRRFDPAWFARQGQRHMEISKVDNEIQGALGRIVGC